MATGAEQTAVSHLDQFLSLHEDQLLNMGMPRHLHELVFHKVHHFIFDASKHFAFDPKPNGERGFNVVYAAEGWLKAESEVFLIDHAFTYSVGPALRHFLSTEDGLYERLARLLVMRGFDDVPPTTASKSTQIEYMVSHLWCINDAYSVVISNDAGEEERQWRWFVNDELGSTLAHSNNPNFRMAQFFVMGRGQCYSLLWPVKEVHTDDICTRDYLQGPREIVIEGEIVIKEGDASRGALKILDRGISSGELNGVENRRERLALLNAYFPPSETPVGHEQFSEALAKRHKGYQEALNRRKDFEKRNAPATVAEDATKISSDQETPKADRRASAASQQPLDKSLLAQSVGSLKLEDGVSGPFDGNSGGKPSSLAGGESVPNLIAGDNMSIITDDSASVFSMSTLSTVASERDKDQEREGDKRTLMKEKEAMPATAISVRAKSGSMSTPSARKVTFSVATSNSSSANAVTGGGISAGGSSTSNSNSGNVYNTSSSRVGSISSASVTSINVSSTGANAGSTSGNPSKSSRFRKPTETIRKVFTDLALVKIGLKGPGSFKEVLSAAEADIIFTGTLIPDLKAYRQDQFLNQFPGECCITVKDLLLRTIYNYFGDEVDWYPTSYILNEEYDAFMGDYLERRRKREDNIWIVKPWNGTRSEGITVAGHGYAEILKQMVTGPKIVSKYIHEPALLGGKKFDLRFIVALKSVNPLQVYVSNNTFYPRIANKNYTLENFDDFQVHYSVMKYRMYPVQCLKTREFVQQIEEAFPKIGWSKVQDRIFKVIKNLFVAATSCPPTVAHVDLGASDTPQAVFQHDDRCRAIYGVDIMLDKHLNPFLLEVSFSPDTSRVVADYPKDRFYKDTFAFLFADVDDPNWVLL